MNPKIITKIQSSPHKTGVYIFYQNKTPLYIGKASSLKNRLKSYLKINDLKTKVLDQEADNLKYIVCHSPIEALIQESNLIKNLKPKYNVIWQDDKNYFYVAFTKKNSLKFI